MADRVTPVSSRALAERTLALLRDGLRRGENDASLLDARDFDAGYWRAANDALDTLTREVLRLLAVEEAARKARLLVEAQAEDEALWALNLDGTLPISEAYLQQELRRLHEAVELVPVASLTAAAAESGTA